MSDSNLWNSELKGTF